MAQIQRPLTTEEAAEYLQVTVDTVRRYIREGRLKALQLGRGVSDTPRGLGRLSCWQQWRPGTGASGASLS